MIDRAGAVLDDLQGRIGRSADAARAYLASPEGQQLRRRVAQALIVSAPLLARSRLFRATWAGRVLGVVGGAALMVKLAEALREWDPSVR